ncbi:MAG TPA: CidA/LrgA family protein [Usitatibacteraceae bacterium]
MLAAFTLLLVFQTIGEVLARVLALPVPGPVIGMALLFAWLTIRRGPSGELRSTATQLLSHLSLLFIPAGVGVMLHFERLRSEWLPISAALLISTTATIAVSAWVLNKLKRKTPAP